MAESTEDQFNWWHQKLAGKDPDWERGHPPSGYFRRNFTVNVGEPGKRIGKPGTEAIAIWRNDDGEVLCHRTSGFKTPQDVDEIEELFAQISRSPVSYEDYRHFRDNDEWPARESDVPDAIATIGDNSGALETDLQRAVAAVDDLMEKFNDWQKSIDGKITTQEQADKAAHFADQFGRCQKRADDLRKVEKEPHLKAGRDVDGAWKPVIATAETAKKDAKDLITPFLRAKAEKERKRAEEERKNAEEEAKRAVEENDFIPPEPVKVSEPKPVSVGSAGRKTSLRTYKYAEVTDVKACAGYFASFNNPPTELVELLTKLARKSLDAGHEVPGAELKQEMRAA